MQENRGFADPTERARAVVNYRQMPCNRKAPPRQLPEGTWEFRSARPGSNRRPSAWETNAKQAKSRVSAHCRFITSDRLASRGSPPSMRPGTPGDSRELTSGTAAGTSWSNRMARVIPSATLSPCSTQEQSPCPRGESDRPARSAAAAPTLAERSRKHLKTDEKTVEAAGIERALHLVMPGT